MPKFTVTLTNKEAELVSARYGWTETVQENGADIPNPVTAKEFFSAWLPNFLAGEIYEREMYEAAQVSTKAVNKRALAKATEAP